MSSSPEDRGAASRPRRPRFDDLPLFAKLLVPFIALLVVVGSFGTFLLVRNESATAQTRLDQALLETSLAVRSELQAQELSLLEGANLAANLQGVPEAVRDLDADSAEQLLRSVVALKSDVDWVALLLADGVTWVTLDRSGQRVPPLVTVDAPPVAAVRGTVGTTKQPGFVAREGADDLVIVAPVCLDPVRCQPVGVAVVGRSLSQTVQQALATPEMPDGTIDPEASAAVRLIDADGRVLASVGDAPLGQPALSDAGGELVRVEEPLPAGPGQTLYAPLSLQGLPAGVVAVSLPTALAFDEVRSTGRSLSLIMLAFLLGIIAIGTLLSRRILRQVRTVVATNDALGAGDLSARAEVTSRDEIGQVAEGLNAMAERLQATYDTLEMRVEERTERVRELLEQRTQFFASLSHELRTPLAIVINQADMLMLDEREDTAKLAEPIKQSAEQLLATVNEILDVARAEAGTLEVDAAAVDLRSFLDDLSPTIRGLASRGDIDVGLHVPAGLPPASADPRRLRQVVMNLIDNAVKYTPAGGHVDVRAAAVAQAVELTVADTGIGIPADVGDAIFEPFQRVEGNHPHRGQSSSGLGLALVHRLVEAQGGTISYASRPGAGTTFRVRLPRAVPVPPPGPTVGASVR